ncbi:MAG TPA: hypothetical protein VGM67_16685 [Gemmatimonadaceae bacterium]|jgi:hypothetical protein
MSRFSRSALLVAVLAATPAMVHAQDDGKGFMFGAPIGSFTLNAGWAVPSAGSDLFSFTTNQLTLRRSDFSSPVFGGSLEFHVLSRTDVLVSANSEGMHKESEFRNFVDNDQQPIQQSTSFQRIPLLVGVKQYLNQTGRSIGRLAWIPSRFAPYVGAAGGATWYQFRQGGDFIDFNTNDVFSDAYRSEGWAPAAQVMAGVDYAVGPRYAITTEAKYLWSRAPLSGDFSGFHNVDLSGLATTVGFTVRF